jgi:peptidoglycan-N-acetylglucosamine deacetylase
MKRALTKAVQTCGRPVKRMLEAAVDNRLVDFHMPQEIHGDVLLTFDDGPHPEVTPRLLDLLDEHGAKGLFFVIGERAERHPELVRAYHDRGHVVANHTYTHLNDFVGGGYSRERVVEDIGRCSALVQRLTGRPTRQFRPPRGELNPRTWKAARDCAHRLMLWSIEGGEWGRRKHWSAEDISAFVSSRIRRRDILLLHDDNEKTLVIMSNLLEVLKARGFDMASGAASIG